ncbi:hypothetical protein GF385_03215 [Candidatus Dependentiae bacterium]|nr:hypothetical protein [Candidatus Dependentiae bacterium]
MTSKSFWQKKISFKNLKVPRFMSAPIDGVIDSSLRQLIRKYSKEELLWGQMRHVASIANAKTLDEFNINKTEHPICFQISANSTNFIEESVEKILEHNFDMINLNSGCPAKKIINSKTGCALMADLPMLKNIITTIKNNVKDVIPFTIKIRAGFKEKNALQVALLAQDLGVDGIIIHPRLKDQGFSGSLDFDLVKKIKKTIKIPVIFSGNIVDAKSAIEVYKKTGVDGFMIGRALYGAPWKIEEIKQELIGKIFNISEKAKIKVALEHLRLNNKHYGHKVGFNILKKHLPMYIKNIENAAQIRKSLVMADTEIKMKNILNNLLEKL